jgi:hypothetical protein
MTKNFKSSTRAFILRNEFWAEVLLEIADDSRAAYLTTNGAGEGNCSQSVKSLSAVLRPARERGIELEQGHCFHVCGDERLPGARRN